MENCKFPMDLLIDILARLPVKSLMRFKCVCRFFYDLIKNNHQFMHKHYEFSRAKNHCAVIEFRSAKFPRPNLVFNLLYKEAESDEVVCMYLDMPNLNSNSRYVKCCHGMLCLILCRGDLDVFDITNITSPDIIFDVLILNPSTREIKALPCIKVPDKPPNKPRLHIEFGFGLSNNMTWKIIMLLSFQDALNWENEDGHGIVMVCSQVGDLWSWRQIDAPLYAPYLPSHFHIIDFYFKGKYYWQRLDGHLVWFDMDDEVFGKIEVPSKFRASFFTVMNESIAAVTIPDRCTENEICTEIWVMDENNNNINWHKQASIYSSAGLFEYFTPIGFWNPSGHLLVFSGYLELRRHELSNDDGFFFKDGFEPNLISVDLVTQERRIIFTSQERKSTLNIVLNSAGEVQVCSERSINKIQEWNDSNIVWNMGAYVRIFNESLTLL